jgi:hypothetical protein
MLHDAEIRYWQQVAKGGDANTLRVDLDKQLHKLDDDFAFIAECNEGGEFMAAEKIERLAVIADQTSPSKQQKLNATANAFGAPIRPRHLVPTQQGIGTLAPNDLTPCRMAFYFVSTFAIKFLVCK